MPAPPPLPWACPPRPPRDRPVCCPPVLAARPRYLFEAIERRCGNQSSSASSSRVQYSAVELKKLVLDASEGVDDKSSAHDFVDTLERIVNEIKNTTEHSAAFLQKVRKTDVPDYYDIIKHPMDLATLAKRVKQQMYRSKKAFADELDLIWSNCLLYNSHPGHPLRRSAEILRAKSNQLLEFISDPALPIRSLYAQTVATQVGGSSSRHRNSVRGTPAPGDEADVEGDDGSEAGARARSVSVALGRHSSILQAANERLLNGVNGDARERSSSPMSGPQTPLASTFAPRNKLGRGPLGRSPSPTPEPELPFEERPALIRTAQGMLDFASLDDELSRLDAELERNPVASTSKLIYTNPTSLVAKASKTSLVSEASSHDSAESQSLLYKLVHSLNPAAYPSPPPSIAPTNGDSSSSGATGEASPPSATTTVTSRPNLDEPPDSLWWETVAPSVETVNCLHDVDIPSTASFKALAAGMPLVPWRPAPPEAKNGCRVKRRKLAKSHDSEARGENGVAEVPKATTNGKKVSKVKTNGTAPNKNAVPLVGLGRKMHHNTETLRKIRRLHKFLSSGTRTPPSMMELRAEGDIVLPVAADLSESDIEDSKRPRGAAYLDSGVPASAFRTADAPKAARQSMEFVTTRVLEHVGFESSSSIALDVMTHVASEYLSNLGRTMKFFADRFGDKMSTEQLLLHVLSENGVASPSDLHAYVSDDIDKYGATLDGLHGKMDKARRDQIQATEVEATVDESKVFLEDDELAIGTLSSVTGEDFFGLEALGLDKENHGATHLSIPSHLFSGQAEPVKEIEYPPPPLTMSAISALPRLLQPYFALRAANPDLGLQEDHTRLLPGLPGFLPRAKISPLTGKISAKGALAQKRKLDELMEVEGLPSPTVTVSASSIDTNFITQATDGKKSQAVNG
ncbi:BZ3500_MvSof-1268-A1-R1_Chr1-3g02070 [Microbotryum saponariae]|uniref:BZ3500_MvSof-1268-A1-R1_Chr1-3g02070 protein n=1 Tax=Microbotryum saponariae TaxID=289078 RepID=A0A2X0KDS3_9BASI|nr:BZ3500_MvSof-1268-A1-R1_Chr1-3g02070 [Microbotryum saponariae]SCZ95324.1 BZ3501_MvSof-1269-A2-R1_Chr1-3g01672 [Microbotryum saponariae]